MDIITKVAAKVRDRIRLSDDDALQLFEATDLTAIGQLADDANRGLNNDTVFFNVNRHINPTNICALSCKFCAYSRKPGEEGAYAYSIDEMVKKAGEAVQQGATEVHMVGGLHPRWRLDHYEEMIAAVKSAFPSLHIKAFTAVELDWFARRARKSVAEVLTQLKDAGLGSLPGGGAEIFHPEIRGAICDTKVTAEQWLNTHRTAHRLGMHSNCTMLYGHIERYEHRVDHMRRLRELQDETHGFNAFIPLAFQPFQNEMGIDRYTYGYDDLKTLAIARLYLDNFRHIKAYWIMLGQDIAQLALQFGANDLDGTVIEEKISRMAGGRAGMAMSRSFIENLVLKAKRHPCERDTLYRAIGQPVKAAGPNLGPALAAAREKAEFGAALDLGELEALAKEAPLHALGRLAGKVPAKEAHFADGSFVPSLHVALHSVTSVGEAIRSVQAKLEASRQANGLLPLQLIVDLAPTSSEEASRHDVGLLLEVLWAFKHSLPEIELVLSGMKSLWTLAQEEHATVAELLSQLKEAGLEAVYSSPEESETDLTHSEAALLHRQIHAADLLTIAKLEIIAPKQGASEPLWEAFLRRALAFAALGEETGGLIGLSVEAARGSFVTAVEYMRAVTLARLAARTVPHVIAPLAIIPTLSNLSGLGAAAKQHPAEKLGSVSLHFGASDLGSVDVEKLNPIAVMKQIRAAGFRPTIRDGRPHDIPGFAGLNLRHVPGATFFS